MKFCHYITGEHRKYLVGPAVHTKTYVFPFLYQYYVVLFYYCSWEWSDVLTGYLITTRDLNVPDLVNSRKQKQLLLKKA